uniref:Uncharacterized protein n=1 Tax=Amphimedon queenslandica TaxID=400682 RepID=A0A1X7U6T8_AMPQE
HEFSLLSITVQADATDHSNSYLSSINRSTMEARVAALTKSIEDTNKQNAALFERISSLFDEVAELAAKKPKIDRTVLEFRSKGNEDQFVFAKKIEEQLRSPRNSYRGFLLWLLKQSPFHQKLLPSL